MARHACSFTILFFIALTTVLLATVGTPKAYNLSSSEAANNPFTAISVSCGTEC